MLGDPEAFIAKRLGGPGELDGFVQGIRATPPLADRGLFDDGQAESSGIAHRATIGEFLAGRGDAFVPLSPRPAVSCGGSLVHDQLDPWCDPATETVAGPAVAAYSGGRPSRLDMEESLHRVRNRPPSSR